MTARTSTGSRPVFSASNARDIIAASLSDIKAEDDLTDADLGRVLGKSEDQAAKYRTGLAEMPAFALLAAWREWNGRFIGPIRTYVEDSRPIKTCDRSGQTSILGAALALSAALEDDDEITAEEVRANRKAIEAARDALEAQLAKLRPGEAA